MLYFQHPQVSLFSSRFSLPMVPLLGISQVPPLKIKQQNTARLLMSSGEDKTYQKGQQVDTPKAETGKLLGERKACALSLFPAICGWPLTVLLGNGPLP